MLKVLTVFGTRPEAIKMAVLVKELNKEVAIEHKVCLTAQHRQMLDQVMGFFDIKADFDLNIMQPNQDLTDITARILSGLRDLFQTYKPDIMLVHGDTTTCMAATLAGFYAGIKVAHVEAGLRTFNLRSPFPEEGNRLITDRLAHIHFAPTALNKDNLLKEGINESSIVVTGNTVIDALLFAKDKVTGFTNNVIDSKVRSLFESDRKILLVTGHRRENFGTGFLQICEALKEIAITIPSIEIVYPVHLNPNVQKPVNEILNNISNIHLVAPMDYADFVFAMKRSWAILTDSGGVQEEAPSLGKPVLVMRDTTERPEALIAGTVKLVGAVKESIVEGITRLYLDTEAYVEMSHAHNPYGDGQASKRILTRLLEKG
jgi:UDP-N-acetylglucosamine 2-epimerase (non-hydrolysing)